MLDNIKNRRSIRKYKNTEVSDDKIVSVIESARIAPSGSNTQPWKYIIVKSKSARELIANCANHQAWMTSAPVHIVAVADISSRIKNAPSISIDEDTCLFEVKQIIRDTAFSIENILLEAVSQGLGTCVVADFRQESIRPILNIPDGKFVVAVITLGYAQSEQIRSHTRKPLEDIICHEQWE